MGPSSNPSCCDFDRDSDDVMLVIADTAFAQVQPTPTTMLKCFKELYDATWFFAFLARAYDELLHVNSSRRYLLISPCRDETQYLRRTLDSVAAQSVPPALWVVIDDGSTDETPAILEEYARRLPYLRVIRRTDRGGRQVGPGVIEALLRRPGEGVPGGLRLPVQALHGPRSAGPLLRAADAANGELSASRDDLRQAVVRTPATRRAGAGGLRG